MKLKIEIGDKQPLPCTKCGGFHGYQYSDYIKVHYDCIYDENGVYEGGVYSDFCRPITEGTTAYCSNCGARLSFGIIRN